MENCNKLVGSPPFWISYSQWVVDGCRCIRPPHHIEPCACEHTIEKAYGYGETDDDLPKGK